MIWKIRVKSIQHQFFLVSFCLALMFSVSEADARTEVDKHEIGPFDVTIERWSHDTPITHAPNSGKNVSLKWLSSDKKVEISLLDNGYTVSLNFDYKQNETDSTCRRSADFSDSIGGKPSNPAFWNWTMTSFSSFFETHCPALTDKQRLSYVREISTDTQAYPAAADFWKDQLLVEFNGRTKRCKKFRDPSGMIQIEPLPCEKWSKGWK